MTNHFDRLSLSERPQSLAAMWCQRLAVFAVPYFLIVILGHRFGAIETPPAFWLLGIGVLMLTASVASGIYGFYELWTFGHKAGISATRGTLLGLFLLLPFLYHAVLAFSLPQLFDISTDLDDPPAYDTVLNDRGEDMNPIVLPGEAQKQAQLTAYPRIAARRYPLDTGRVFKAIVKLVKDRDWKLLAATTIQGQATVDDEGSGLVAKPVVDAQGNPLRVALPTFRPSQSRDGTPVFDSIQVSPIGREETEEVEEQDERYVEAVARSFLLGFESDVVIRLVEEEEGALVDMRSNVAMGVSRPGIKCPSGGELFDRSRCRTSGPQSLGQPP